MRSVAVQPWRLGPEWLRAVLLLSLWLPRVGPLPAPRAPGLVLPVAVAVGRRLLLPALPRLPVRRHRALRHPRAAATVALVPREAPASPGQLGPATALLVRLKGQVSQVLVNPVVPRAAVAGDRLQMVPLGTLRVHPALQGRGPVEAQVATLGWIALMRSTTSRIRPRTPPVPVAVPSKNPPEK